MKTVFAVRRPLAFLPDARVGDFIVYDPGAERPFTLHRPIRVDQGALMGAELAGDLDLLTPNPLPPAVVLSLASGRQRLRQSPPRVLPLRARS
jgi:hypothetical protein